MAWRFMWTVTGTKSRMAEHWPIELVTSQNDLPNPTMPGQILQQILSCHLRKMNLSVVWAVFVSLS